MSFSDSREGLSSKDRLRQFRPGRVGESSLAVPSFLSSSVAAWTALDLLSTLILFTLAEGGHLSVYALRVAIPFAVFITFFAHMTGLHRTILHRGGVQELLLILRSALLGGLTLYGLQRIWGVELLTFRSMMSDAVLAGIPMYLARALWRRRRERLYHQDIALRNFVVIGVDDAGRDVREYLTTLRYAGYRFKGYIPLSEPADRTPAGDCSEEIAGGIDNIAAIVRRRFVDEIVFSHRPMTPGVLSRTIRQAQAMGVTVRLIPSLTETLINRTDVEYIGDLPTIVVSRIRRRAASLLLKRMVDIAVASAASIALLPVFLAVAIAVKLQSPGPILYCSKRIGHKGRVFTCYKFRTMVDNATALQAQIAHLNERTSVLFKVANDPRITRVGAFLRKYSLDELPQLWNVIRGDMSLVGPRPSIASEVAQYRVNDLRRLDALPGMTGLWQVEARQDPSFESYIHLDSQYVNQWSFWLDLKILFRTIDAVLNGTGS